MDKTQLLTHYAPWLLEATRLLGTTETPGPKTTGAIAAMLKGLHAWWGDDETPWCGTFVAHCLKSSSMPIAKQWWRARGWEGFGQELVVPKTSAGVRHIPYGALVVLSRPPRPADGHVGFFAGRVAHSTWNGGGVSLLAGNQGNAVGFASFPLERVVYWCWPGASLSRVSGECLVALANGQPIGLPSTGEA